MIDKNNILNALFYFTGIIVIVNSAKYLYNEKYLLLTISLIIGYIFIFIAQNKNT